SAETETGTALLATVEDEVCAVREGGHARDHTFRGLFVLLSAKGERCHAFTHHSLDFPLWMRHLRLDRHAVIKSNLRARDCPTADQDRQGVGVWSMLGQYHGRPFK